MKKLQKIVCFFAGIICACMYHTTIYPYALAGSSVYAARSQSVNAARDLVGFCQFLHKQNNGFEGMLIAAPEFQRSFRSPRIAEYFFNNDTVGISGSRVINRNENDMLADYFGLSPSFASNLVMRPTIESALINFDAYLCYHAWYLRVQAPVCWSRWHYQLNECTTDTGSIIPFPENYMAHTAVPEAADSFSQAICGNQPWGDVKQGLLNSIICGPRSSHGVADMRMFFGWHILRNENHYVGINLIAAAPTGSRIHGKYFFEPIVGNGHHWEIGVGLDGRVLTWECNGDHTLSLYGTVHATHLCKTTQHRAFDFCRNGFASRYLLLKEFDSSQQYTGTLVPASTVTTLPCHVWSVGQFDLVAMLGYLSRNLEIDLGYNAWIRTREHVKICGTVTENRYGIKGIQNVTDELGNPDNTTQSNATIHGNILTAEEQAATADANSPVFIQTTDLNPCSAAATSAFTNKFFAHIGYKWTDYCHAQPYLGIGGEVEFEGLAAEHNRQANHNTVAQWALWIKGGSLFN